VASNVAHRCLSWLKNPAKMAKFKKVCVCVCMYACVRVCVRVLVCVRARECMCVFACRPRMEKSHSNPHKLIFGLVISIVMVLNARPKT